MPSETIRVRIGGREYTLSSAESSDWTRRVADYVDRKVNEVSMHTSMSPEISAIITALSVTEELFHAQEELRHLHDRLYRLEMKAACPDGQTGEEAADEEA